MIIFEPDSTITIAVNAVATIVIVLSSWLYAFVAAFSFEEVDHLSDGNLIIYLILLDLFFALIIIKNLLTGFIPVGKLYVIKDLTLIRREYFKKGAFIDILAWIPIQTILCFNDP